jgi:hypothetical protein
LHMVRDRLGPPADFQWVGIHATFTADSSAHWITGRTPVYSLQLDDRLIYSLDEMRKFQDDERPKLLALAFVLLLFGVGVLAWRMKSTSQTRAPSPHGSQN